MKALFYEHRHSIFCIIIRLLKLHFLYENLFNFLTFEYNGITMIDIQQLADQKGIARQYIDASHNLITLTEESRVNTLEILGYPVHDQKALEAMLQEEVTKEFKNVVDPVCILNDEDHKQVYIRVPESFGEDENATITLEIKLEDGRSVQRTLPLEQVEIADFKTVDNVVYDIRRYQIITNLPYGYHHLSCEIKSKHKTIRSIEMSLIRTPVKMYTPQEIESGKKVWGVSSQLYSVRSRDNWGIGDFADLRQLLLGVHKCGGQFVGLNPMHAGYPANPDESCVSPYSPSSRNWINIIYISVNEVPELQQCQKALDLIHSQEYVTKINELRQREYVDYRGVLQLKLQAFRTILDNVNATFKEGNIYGLIGRNGSGKSVFLKILCNFYSPTSGEVLYDGINIFKENTFPPDTRALIEKPAFLPDISGFENLKMLASIQQLIGADEILEALEKVNLIEDKDKKYKVYSLGMKQKLGIAQVIMENPKVLILDEPFNGIEDATASKLRKLLKEEAKKGKIVIVASHIKEDIINLANVTYKFDGGNVTKI